MADQRDVMRGLEILMGYKPDGVTWNCDAQHDELFAEGPDPEALGGDDARELADRGWTWTGECWRRFT